MPKEFTGYTLRHQFRAKPDAWPVTQLGPGLLTVNETSGYEWKSFNELIQEAIEALFASYPSELSEVKPVRLELRYINAIPCNQQHNDVITLLRKFLHTSIQIETRLFPDLEKDIMPSGLALSLNFPLPQLSSTGQISFSTALREDKPVIMFELIMRNQGENVPQKTPDISAWTNAVHEIAEKWFLNLTDGELLKSFEEVPNVS